MLLSINNLTKEYNSKKRGVSDYSIDIPAGVLGLLGPNGAGKSTLIKMISTIMKPTKGSISLNGIDIIKKPNYMRKTLGYLPQDFGVYKNLNAYEFLSYISAMKGIGGNNLKNRIEKLLQEVNLIDIAENKLETYSGGMVQRIGIAQALLNDPKVLIFDEPTVGLDPEERLRFRNLITNLGNERIVIFSSHIVSDIESICDEIVIMKKGKLIIKGNKEKIIETVKGKVFECTIHKDDLLIFKENNLIISSHKQKDTLKVRFISEKTDIAKKAVMATLEDAYIYLTKNNLL